MTIGEGRPRTGKGYEISELDKRIIEQLQEEGRRPFTQIAADLGVSEAAVRARTNRMIDKGILQIVGVTDPAGGPCEGADPPGARRDPGDPRRLDWRIAVVHARWR